VLRLNSWIGFWGLAGLDYAATRQPDKALSISQPGCWRQVEGYAAHEKEVFEHIAHTKYLQASLET